MRNSRALAGAPIAALIAVSLAAPVRAQSGGDSAEARALFSEARKLAKAGNYEAACPKFEESLRLDNGIGTLFNAADCWEHIGKSATAWAAFLDVAAQARAAGQGDREKAARDRAKALEPKLAHLTLQPAAPEAGLEIQRDGRAVGEAAWNTAVPVDPGAHHIQATAPGKKTWALDVTVAAGASVPVPIPKLEVDTSAPATSGAAPSSSTNGGAPPAVTASTELGPAHEAPAGAGSGQKTAGLVVAGVGVLGVAAGTVFALKSSSANSDAEKICVGNAVCSGDDIKRHDGLVSDAKSDRTLAIVGFGVGGAALITGAVLFFTASPARQNAGEGFRVHLIAGNGALGGVAEGRW